MNSINYSVVNDWGTGFTADMKIKAEDTGLNGWTIGFDASFDIVNIWNAEIVSHVGNHYILRNASWNSQVSQGGIVTFGFQAAAGSSGTVASGFTINGSNTSNTTPTPLPTLLISDASIIEGNTGDQKLAFKVDLSKAASTSVSVNFNTEDQTATSGLDYSAQSGVITFAPGETTKTIYVPIIADTKLELNETFTVSLSPTNDATILKSKAIGTITNDDTSSTSTNASLNYSVINDWGTGFTTDMKIKAEDTGLNGWTIGFDAPFNIVNIWNAEIASHVGNHYILRNASWNSQVSQGGMVTFGFQAEGSSSGTTVSDFTVNGSTISNTTPTPLPTLSISDASIIEGNTGDQNLAFKVDLSMALSTSVSVNINTEDQTAISGLDYSAQSGTITFAPGETTKTILVPIVADTKSELRETFAVSLSPTNDATILKSKAIGTIIDNDTTAANSTLTSWLSTSGNQIIDDSGHSFQIEGVNWFGFESSTLAPHGLWTRGYKDMMNQMKDLGFNSIRLPFSSDTLHSNESPNGIDFSKNPDLKGLTAIQIMDKIVNYADEIGLRIILDHHRSDSGAGTSGNGLWYDAQHSQAQWISDWQMLATRYSNNSAVIGADLHNEPYNGTWGGGGGNDWAAAAEQAGNAIGQVNSNWLIFVEGVGNYKGENYWWGGNLMGVKDRPIELAQQNKLVYSAHDYPNSVYPQTWFQQPDFAQNLPSKFDQMWGYIYKEGIAPLYIGEFGSALVDPKDAPWLETLTSYMSGDFDNDGSKDISSDSKGISWSYWSWNPNSGDTGGILGNDWNSVNQNKLNYLEFNDTIVLGTGNDTYIIDNPGDIVTEQASAGTDLVKTTLDSYTLGPNVENLTYTGSGNFAGTGNSLANVITGGTGNDTLNGSTGADTMVGGAGNDTYVVDNTGDVVTELSNAGTDSVQSSVTYTLGVNVENLTLAGSSAINGTGNDLNNILTGNTGENSLSGGNGADQINGGKAADILTGGAAKDTFIFTTGDSGQTTGFDKISDFTKGAVGTGDVIDFSSALTIGGSASAATSSQAAINQSTGVATFFSGSGTTLTDAIGDIASRLTAATNSVGELAFFKVNNTGDYYSFVSDGVAGVTANDNVIQLVGVTSISSINLTNGDLTLTG